MNDNPRIYLDHEQRPDSIERRHDWRICAHNQQARIRGALLRERRLARDLASTRRLLAAERKRADYHEHERGEWSAFGFKQAAECVQYIEQIGNLTDALQREIERTTRLEDDLARARAVNEQAEKVRDENDRLRRDLDREREAHEATRAELNALHDVLSGRRTIEEDR